MRICEELGIIQEKLAEMIKMDRTKATRAIKKLELHEFIADENKVEQIEAYVKTAFHLNQLLKELQHPSSQFYFVQVKGEVAGYLKINMNDANQKRWGVTR